MEINSLNKLSVPLFHRSERKPRPGIPETGSNSAVEKGSLVGVRRSQRQETRRRSRRKRRGTSTSRSSSFVAVSGCGEDEKAEVERKIVTLQRIVPGGEALGVDKLFEETAEYILALQCQIKAMRVFTSFLEGLEKENMKFGG